MTGANRGQLQNPVELLKCKKSVLAPLPTLSSFNNRVLIDPQIALFNHRSPQLFQIASNKISVFISLLMT